MLNKQRIMTSKKNINNKKRVLISVLNDLYTDPRVDKVCRFLVRNGFAVTLIGCRHKDSPKLGKRNYLTKRLSLFFKKGPLFFAEFNVKLFFFLLFHPCDVLTANDLDTLLPTFLVGKIKNRKVVYDSHEYYCNMITVINKPMTRRIWRWIEKFCFSRLKFVTTVSNSIALEYKKEYGVDVKVVRNIPPAFTPPVSETRKSLHLPEDKMIVIMQGNHICPNRGAEELLEAMPFVDSKAVLLFVGSGDLIHFLKQRASELKIEERVLFVDRVSPEKLFSYTSLSDIGVSLGKNVSFNHYYSLPNKIFEYIKAGIPVITSDFPERAAIIQQYGVGATIKGLSTEIIAEVINGMVNNQEQYQLYKNNCIHAAKKLTWENEELVLEEIYL